MELDQVSGIFCPPDFSVPPSEHQKEHFVLLSLSKLKGCFGAP